MIKEKSELPTGTVTFLFTDIEGSTQLLHQLREKYGEILLDHRDLMRQSFENWNGHEIDTQGDSFFIAFPSASDAMSAAIESQRALHGHNWPEGAEVRVRMGMHTGEPVLGPTGYIGVDVHRAARIADAGHGGQILVSSSTEQLLRGDVPNDARFVYLGEHGLKDLSEPVHIFELRILGLPHDFPPLRTLNPEEYVDRVSIPERLIL